jgi:hypothetical protein
MGEPTTVCRVIRPPQTDACGDTKPTHRVIFADGDASLACELCAVYLRDLAQAHGTRVRIERL